MRAKEGVLIHRAIYLDLVGNKLMTAKQEQINAYVPIFVPGGLNGPMAH